MFSFTEKHKITIVKEIYPDRYPWSDRWDMNASLGFASASFGMTAGWSIGNGTVYDREKDEFVFSPATDNFKDLVTYFHTLIDEGLLDPESLTQGDDAAIQKFVNGETFMISTGAAGINDYRTSMDEILGEENYKIALIPTPDGPTGVIGGTRVDVGTIISASTVKNENFIAMLQFIDWLYYSEEGREFAIWGVEGETFTRDDEGNRVLMDQYNNGEYNLNPIGTEDLVEDHGFINGVFTFTFGSSDDLFLSLLSDEIKEYWQTVTQTRTFAEPTPNVIFTVQEQEKMTLTEAAITDYIRQNKLEFILGQRDLNEYDDFVKELEELGSNTLLGLINEAYQRTKNK